MRLPKFPVNRDPDGDTSSELEVGSAAGSLHPITRLLRELDRGSTVEAAARRAGLRPEIAEIMIDYLRRAGKLSDAGSLCSSGLGACGTGALGGHESGALSDISGADSSSISRRTIALHCAGCPMAG